MVERFGLYLILTDPDRGYEYCTKAAVDAGLRYLQLRMKNTPRDEIRTVAEKLREITQGTQTRFIVNDHLDVAMDVDADGVHLGQHDLDLKTARNRWKTPGKCFGLSTHSPAQEEKARALVPDYIGVGPVFATPTKTIPDPTVGVETMGRIVENSPLTTVAIGGIDPENLPRVLDAGAINFAVVRAVNRSDDPAAAIGRLMRIWEEWEARRRGEGP